MMKQMVPYVFDDKIPDEAEILLSSLKLIETHDFSYQKFKLK